MNSPINPETAVATLVDSWLEKLRAERRLDGTTIREYERVLRNLVIPSIGAVRISEVTTSRIDEVLVELGGQSLNRQRKAKVVMGAMLNTAVELGALPFNPVRGSLSSGGLRLTTGRSPWPISRTFVRQFELGSARSARGRSRPATSRTSSR